MKTSDTLRLLALAAIWGGSFIFMRVLAPVLGPVLTADLRLLIAGIALLLYFRAIKFDPAWSRYWRQYLIIGAVNSALPFFLFSWAALHIPASLSVILNSASPLFAAVFAAVWLGESITIRKAAGLLIGAAGVAVVMRPGPIETTPMFGWAIAACILAAACYGFAATYIRKHGGGAKPMGIAAGSQMMAGLVLIPAIPFAPARDEITITAVSLVVIFALLCSAVAYLLYFRLIVDVGATQALTVTFLMPAFGMIWGATILGETITVAMIVGTALILLGTGLVLNVIHFRRTRPAA